MAALSCGIEAEMLGSLMMLASGELVQLPRSARASSTSFGSSGNCARIRPAAPRVQKRGGGTQKTVW